MSSFLRKLPPMPQRLLEPQLLPVQHAMSIFIGLALITTWFIALGVTFLQFLVILAVIVGVLTLCSTIVFVLPKGKTKRLALWVMLPIYIALNIGAPMIYVSFTTSVVSYLIFIGVSSLIFVLVQKLTV